MDDFPPLFTPHRIVSGFMESSSSVSNALNFQARFLLACRFLLGFAYDR